MKGKEFDEVFQVKVNEFCQKLATKAQEKGFIVHSVDVDKQRDFTYILTMMISIQGMRMIPSRTYYTVMYNPKNEQYIWHEGLPRAPKNLDERVVN